MKKLKLKIKFFLMRFFGIDKILGELEESRVGLESALKMASAQQYHFQRLAADADDFNINVIQRSKCAIDVHQKYGNSWAIIAIGSNPESIRFYSFERNDIKEIREFLKHFDKRNRTVDCPRNIEHHFKQCF